MPRICLLLALVVRPAAAQILAPITLAYNDRPPYILSLPDGSAAGLTATPAAQAFKAAGIPVIWKKSPTNRQLAELKENTDRQCAVGWFKNPEREHYLKFTKSIYRDRPTVLIVNRRFSTHPNETLLSMLARQNLHVLIKERFSYGQYIDNLLATLKPQTIVTTGENYQMVEMVRIGRADFMFASEEEARYLIEQSKLSQRDLRIVHPPDMPPGEQRYIICSKLVEDEAIARLNAAIAAE